MAGKHRKKASKPALAAAETPADDSPKHVEFWLGAPDGSEMSLRVSGTTDKELVLATVRVISQTGTTTSHSNSEVQPGPLKLVFSKRAGAEVESWSVELDLTFVTDEATAAVTADVFGPDGERVPPIFATKIPGTQGQVIPVRFFLSVV